jgi:DNA-binding transcriptional regulator YdaS (Cro superfamily)
MPLDGILKEACAICGGALALARKLNVSKQAIYSFAVDGIPPERVYQIEKLTGIPRSQLFAYSEAKWKAKQRDQELQQHYRPREPRPERPPLSVEELEANARAAWRYFDAYPLWRNRDRPPPFPRPPDVPGPPPLLPEVEAIIAGYPPPFKVDHKESADTRDSLEGCARILREGKVGYHVRTYPPLKPITPRLRAIGVGTWSAPARALPYFRAIAAHFGAREEVIDGAVVFFPAGGAIEEGDPFGGRP